MKVLIGENYGGKCGWGKGKGRGRGERGKGAHSNFKVIV